METKRFQLDLTEHEHAEMEKLMAVAGTKTKREFVSNALTLFRWAATELSHGRAIASVDAQGRAKQLEMPALAAFAVAGQRLVEQFAETLANAPTSQSMRPAREVIDEIRQRLKELDHAQESSHLPSGTRATA